MDELSARALASEMEPGAARKNTRTVRGKSVVCRAWETAYLISFKGGANGGWLRIEDFLGRDLYTFIVSYGTIVQVRRE